MSSLTHKTVLITGASSGIGFATAKLFAENHANLILTARRFDRIETLAAQLKQEFEIEVITRELDVRDHNKVRLLIDELPNNFKNIDILINNAGLASGSELIHEGSIEKWETMIDTNVKGLLYLTRYVLPGMIARQSGHIVNLGSMAGRHVYKTGSVYNASKYAVKAISEAIRLDTLGQNIRVTEIAPGAVHTEFSEVRWNDKERADEFYSKFTPLLPEDIADNILYAVTRPPHVNIAELVVYCTEQAGYSFNTK